MENCTQQLACSDNYKALQSCNASVPLVGEAETNMDQIPAKTCAVLRSSEGIINVVISR